MNASSLVESPNTPARIPSVTPSFLAFLRPEVVQARQSLSPNTSLYKAFKYSKLSDHLHLGPVRCLSMASRSTCIVLLALLALATYTSTSAAGESGASAGQATECDCLHYCSRLAFCPCCSWHACMLAYGEHDRKQHKRRVSMKRTASRVLQ